MVAAALVLVGKEAMTPQFGLIGPLNWGELLILLFIVLIIFGPRRLPDVAEALGKSIQKFKRASREVRDEISTAAEEEKDKDKRAKS
jgi:sec-independent protein translocase protein TatA